MCINWTDYAIAIGTLVSAISTALGAFFVVIQIRNGTKAQQDKKAPLILLEKKNNSMAGICISNVGELSATITKMKVKILNNDNKWHKRTITRQIIIKNGESKNIFSIKELEKINTDLIVNLIINIKFISPLNDRKRKYCVEVRS